MSLAANPPALVNALDNAFTGGVLPAALKQIVATAVQADAGTTTLAPGADRAVPDPDVELLQRLALTDS